LVEEPAVEVKEAEVVGMVMVDLEKDKAEALNPVGWMPGTLPNLVPTTPGRPMPSSLMSRESRIELPERSLASKARATAPPRFLPSRPNRLNRMPRLLPSPLIWKWQLQWQLTRAIPKALHPLELFLERGRGQELHLTQSFFRGRRMAVSVWCPEIRTGVVQGLVFPWTTIASPKDLGEECLLSSDLMIQ
jgi:hypothetical protein